MKKTHYFLRRLARYTGVFSVLLGFSVAFLWLNVSFLPQKGIQLANSTTAILYLPLLFLPFVMSGIVGIMKKKTVSSLAFFSFVLGFVLMALVQTGVLYSLPFWNMGHGPEIILAGFLGIALGSTILGLTALRSQSGVPPMIGVGLLLIPASIAGLAIFQNQADSSLIMASFHGLAFLTIGFVFLFSKKGRELRAIPKWALSVAIPAFFITLLAFFINVSAPKMLAINYVEALSGTDLPTDAKDLKLPSKPVFGLPKWIVFEAGSQEVKDWISEGPGCWSSSMSENGKTAFFSKEMGKLYDFWEGRELPVRYSTMKCSDKDPQSYLLIDQSRESDWIVYIHICED